MESNTEHPPRTQAPVNVQLELQDLLPSFERTVPLPEYSNPGEFHGPEGHIDPEARPRRRASDLSSASITYPRVWDVWLLEIAALFAAAAALVTIAGLGFIYRGKAVPQWSSSISMNTIISISSVILTTRVAYIAAHALSQHKWAWFSQPRPLTDMMSLDSASRGPLGAVLLLMRPWR